MAGRETARLTRAQLHRHVWEQPVRVAAPEFAISDVAPNWSGSPTLCPAVAVSPAISQSSSQQRVGLSSIAPGYARYRWRPIPPHGYCRPLTGGRSARGGARRRRLNR